MKIYTKNYNIYENALQNPRVASKGLPIFLTISILISLVAIMFSSGCMQAPGLYNEKLINPKSFTETPRKNNDRGKAMMLAPNAANPVCAFSDLARTDNLVIIYTSAGCYHNFQWEFTFHSEGDGYFEAVEIIHNLSGKSKNAVENPKKYRGKIILEKGEKAKLDALIKYYRLPKDEDAIKSSTVDSINIKQLHRGVVIAEEDFLDDNFPPLNYAEMVRFSEMVHIFK